MTDIFDRDSPLGWLGKIADFIILEAYMRRLLEKRSRVIKEAAEAANHNGRDKL